MYEINDQAVRGTGGDTFIWLRAKHRNYVWNYDFIEQVLTGKVPLTEEELAVERQEKKRGRRRKYKQEEIKVYIAAAESLKNTQYSTSLYIMKLTDILLYSYPCGSTEYVNS